MKGHLRLSGGWKLYSPSNKNTRPTSSRVREAIMNLLAYRLLDSHWLDLCSGSGVMGCEALMRGAKRVVAVERDKKTAHICQKNLSITAARLTHQSQTKVFCREVLNWLKGELQINKHTPEFDLIYFDPPYNSDLYSPVLTSLLKSNLLKKDSLVICEYDSHRQLITPNFWEEVDRRSYGSSSLVLLSPPKSYYDDTDSMHQQRDLEE